MRSGKLKASNDSLIMEYIANNKLEVLEGKVYKHTDSGLKLVCEKFNIKGKPYRYIRYNPSKSNKKLAAHRVVYALLIGTLASDLVINHKNGQGDDNRPENLELVTQSENNLKAFRETGRKAVYGNVILTPKIIRSIRKENANGISYKKLSVKYGISKGHISEIVNRKIWDNV